jgi:hypothetical protein
MCRTWQHGRRRNRRGRWSIDVDAAMRPAGVVVLDIPGEQTPQIWSVADQRPVQTLARTVRIQCAAYAFALGVAGCLIRELEAVVRAMTPPRR